MTSWKIYPHDSKQIEYTPFLECRKYFAVDDSGSTAGAVLGRERTFVESFRRFHANTADKISFWGSRCDNPVADFDSLTWSSSHDATCPSEILRNRAGVDAIKEADVWFLLTDGEIYDDDVHRLADIAFESGILNVPLVFVITGTRGSSPATANISVGISFFASSPDTLILFKEVQTGKIYVIAGKGCFAELGGSAAAQDLTSWKELRSFANEADLFSYCEKREVRVTKAESRASSSGEISLGAAWEAQLSGPVRVDLDALLSSGFLSNTDALNLFADEAFRAIAVASKTRRRTGDLRTYVKAQKVEQVTPEFEDHNGAAGIIARMSETSMTDEDRKRLQQQLREAHALNRQDFQKATADYESSKEGQIARRRNQLVEMALKSLAVIVNAGYNAEIISRANNRARYAESIDSTPSFDVTTLDLHAPSYKGYCLICCGEEEVMSICFKEANPASKEDNTSDFALNYPLAAGASEENNNLVSSQNVCFQCALLGPDNMSIYKERLTAIIPTVQYQGTNKKYINNQLYSALTAGLATGTAGVAQLFMAILMGVMRTKSWAGAAIESRHTDGDDRREATQRRDMFQWMLDQVVRNTSTRENFNETGGWVKFPQTLAWVAEDFSKRGLASFAITYPMAGFDNLIALGQHTEVFTAESASRLQSSKLLYSVAAKYLADLKTDLERVIRPTDSEAWQQKYLELIYNDFNGPVVPVDQGSASILTDPSLFQQRLAACLPTTQHPGTTTTITITTSLIHKLQLLLFWLRTQRTHTTPSIFFSRLLHNEPLAPAVLDPTLTVPPTSHSTILLSIFANQLSPSVSGTALAQHTATPIPFASPFGPSVLRCGIPSCAHPFIDTRTLTPDSLTTDHIDTIRATRAAHLKHVFGVQSRFETSPSGLPERLPFGTPPSSLHSNLHASIVRSWTTLSVFTRQKIVAGGEARAKFVAHVCERMCVEGKGDVFSPGIKGDVEAVLPSFFEVLRVAMRVRGGQILDPAWFVHELGEGKVVCKARWELMVESERGSSA